MTDDSILKWLYLQMDYNDYGWWLPDVCVRERGWGEEKCPRPSFEVFREALVKAARLPTPGDRP